MENQENQNEDKNEDAPFVNKTNVVEEDIIFEKFRVKLELYWKIADVTKWLSLVGLLIFIIILAFKISFTDITFSWFYLLIPSMLTVISITISYVIFFVSIDLISNYTSTGKYIMISVISVSFMLYLVLFCCKAENLIKMKWVYVSIWLFISIFTLSLYFVFLLPDYIRKKQYIDVSVIGLHLIASMICVFLVHYKVDMDKLEESIASGSRSIESMALKGIQEMTDKLGLLLIPLFISLIFNLCVAAYKLIMTNDNQVRKIAHILGVILVIVTLIFVALISDKRMEDNKGYIPLVFFAFAVIFFTIFFMVKPNPEEDVKEDKDDIENTKGNKKEKKRKENSSRSNKNAKPPTKANESDVNISIKSDNNINDQQNP